MRGEIDSLSATISQQEPLNLSLDEVDIVKVSVCM